MQKHQESQVRFAYKVCCARLKCMTPQAILSDEMCSLVQAVTLRPTPPPTDRRGCKCSLALPRPTTTGCNSHWQTITINSLNFRAVFSLYVYNSLFRKLPQPQYAQSSFCHNARCPGSNNPSRRLLSGLSRSTRVSIRP